MGECSHFTNSPLANFTNNLIEMDGSYKKRLYVEPNDIILTEEEKTI